MFKDNPKLKNILLVGFLMSLHVALTTYINSSFLSSFMHEKAVGIIYILGSITSILSLLIIPKIFRKIGGYKFLLIVTLLDALSLLFLSFTTNAWSIKIIFIIYFALNILVAFSLDEILKIFSKDSTTGKIRGLYLTTCNLAWVISQLVSSRILNQSSFRIIYFISFVLMIIFFFVFINNFKDIPDPKYDKTKALKYIKEFLKNKNLFRAYGINLLVQLFFSLMIIYTPIYLSVHLGFAWKEISIIFAIMLLPFLFVPVPVGEYGDKFGERKMLMFGFTITAISTLAIFFIHLHAIWIWALVLFITRTGAATIETMSDVYFFKHIKAENEEFVGVYRSAPPVAFIVGPMIAFVVFSFVPSFNFLYPILGTLMLYGIYLSSTIRKGDI